MRRTGESYFKCVVIPASQRDRVIDMFHTNFHLGIRSTYFELRKYCYWKEMWEDVKYRLSTCVKFQMKNPKKNNGKLNNIYALELLCLD